VKESLHGFTAVAELKQPVSSRRSGVQPGLHGFTAVAELKRTSSFHFADHALRRLHGFTAVAELKRSKIRR